MIKINNVSKHYGNQIIVNNLSLNIEKNTVFGFLGQNGSGKTTTIKMIVGITKPDSGELTIEGIYIKEKTARDKIGFMPEAPYFYDRLSGIEFLKFCSKLFSGNNTSDDRLYEILKQVGIYDAKDKTINKYSKGMKQRLGFAQTLVNDPDYIFLDEPLDGLDPIGRKELKKIISELKNEGKTIFFNSHILFDIEEICDNIGIIHEGKLLFSGPTKEFCRGMSLENRFIETINMHNKGKLQEIL